MLQYVATKHDDDGASKKSRKQNIYTHTPYEWRCSWAVIVVQKISTNSSNLLLICWENSFSRWWVTAKGLSQELLERCAWNVKLFVFILLLFCFFFFFLIKLCECMCGQDICYQMVLLSVEKFLFLIWFNLVQVLKYIRWALLGLQIFVSERSIKYSFYFRPHDA